MLPLARVQFGTINGLVNDNQGAVNQKLLAAKR